MIAEYSEDQISPTSPRWTKNYIYLEDRLLATQEASGNSELVQYTHPDRLGTRIISRSDGTWFEQVTSPFGVALNSESTTASNRRFTSYDRSASTGLDYAVNRSYDPGQGRFTQVDKVGMEAVRLTSPQSLNLYAYCQNDPINASDPLGTWGFSFSFGGFFGGGHDGHGGFWGGSWGGLVGVCFRSAWECWVRFLAGETARSLVGLSWACRHDLDAAKVHQIHRRRRRLFSRFLQPFRRAVHLA